MRMRFLQRHVVAQHERGLLMKDRSLAAVLEPGVHRFLDPLGRIAVEVHDVTRPEFTHPQAEVFARTAPELLRQHLQVVHLGDTEAALVYVDGNLADLLPPGSRRYYWRAHTDVRVEVLDVSEALAVPTQVLTQLLHPTRGLELAKARMRHVTVAEVGDRQVGLLLVDGRLRETLEPGLHGFWSFRHKVQVEAVDQRLQTLDVQGQELLTRDKVTLRVNLTATFRVSDPVRARESLDDVVGFLYRELQFGLRRAFATRTLDALLEHKGQLDEVVHEHVRGRAGPFGLDVTDVGVKDLVLPGEMRELLNQVVEAEKVAQANVIRRREETAATRSLLNTAKLMDENPTLLRLKELEALEKVADKVERLTVFGGLDGVLKDTVRIGIPAG
jgi:regulator of protease activity HflC (stomatin/prohibitin superfamily)